MKHSQWRAFAATLLGLGGCVLPSYSVDEGLGGGGGAGGALPEVGGMLNNCGGELLGGPTMVPVPGGYCIDSTEVTWDQYQEWVAESPEPDGLGLPQGCSYKQSFEPLDGCAIPYSSGAKLFPAVCVDWCDAWAYCHAMGKRLCGAIGGGTNSMADFKEATKSQWYNACSSGGRFRYPYGSTYDAAACYTPGVGGIEDVHKLDSCQSPEPDYAGVFDLSGNVSEWEDSCSGDDQPDDVCRVRGGAFRDTQQVNACDSEVASLRTQRLDNRGFRCCWQPDP